MEEIVQKFETCFKKRLSHQITAIESSMARSWKWRCLRRPACGGVVPPFEYLDAEVAHFAAPSAHRAHPRSKRIASSIPQGRLSNERWRIKIYPVGTCVSPGAGLERVSSPNGTRMMTMPRKKLPTNQSQNEKKYHRKKRKR
jgi:hypothetical protein